MTPLLFDTGGCRPGRSSSSGESGCGLVSRRKGCGQWQEHGLHTALLEKRVKTTLEDLFTPEYIFEAMRSCERNVRWKASVQSYEVNTLRWAGSTRRAVLDGTYKSQGFKRFDVTERGKVRHIQASHISDRTVQKVFCDHTLKPQIFPRLVYDNSASQEGKGVAFALKRLKEHLRWHYARYGKSGAILTMDFSGYFDSIPHGGAAQTLTARERDQRVRRYIAEFIHSFAGERGIGLGSEICQITAICYPTPVDKLIKEQMHIHCYGRYMDDAYLIHHDRAYLEQCRDEIIRAAETLGLRINREKTKIHNLATDDFLYLKKRVRLCENGRVVLRLTRQNVRRERKRILTHWAEYAAGRMPLSAALQSYQSWRSYAKSFNGYHTVGEMDRFFTNVFGDAIRNSGLTGIRYGRPGHALRGGTGNVESATDRGIV